MKNLCDLDFGNENLGALSKAQFPPPKKRTINWTSLIKKKKKLFRRRHYSVERIKRQAKGWEKNSKLCVC